MPQLPADTRAAYGFAGSLILAALVCFLTSAPLAGSSLAALAIVIFLLTRITNHSSL